MKVNFAIITNLRLVPYEQTGMTVNIQGGSLASFGWFKYELWRTVFVQQQIEKLAQTAIDFPPMQKGASFNLEAIKAQVERTIAAHRGN